MQIRFTSVRGFLAAGLAVAGLHGAAQAQAPYSNFRPQVTPPAYAQGYRAPIQQVAAPSPAPAIAAPVYESAPIMVQGPGCEGGSCATGNCNNGYGNGNPASFSPNKPFHCKDGCKPYCATKTYPHSDWHYIKHYCGPSLIPGSCYGHFNTTWRKWEDVCPGWQPNNDPNCNKGQCSTGNCAPQYIEGHGEYLVPGMQPGYEYPQAQPVPPMQPQTQPLPNPTPVPPMPQPAPSPMMIPPAPAPAPMPMPMTLPPTSPTIPPVPQAPGISYLPAVAPQIAVAVATPVAFQMPRPIEVTPSAIRVEHGKLLNDPLALPATVKPLPLTTDIVIPPVVETVRN